jgi:hypothetical protein
VLFRSHQKINSCSCEGTDATEFTPFLPGLTKKMLVDLDDEGNVVESLYTEYEPF